MRRTPILISVTVALYLLLAQPASGAQIGFITGDQVNLRKAPKRSAAVLTTLDLNTKVFIIKTSEEWAYISVPILNRRGWVILKYISKGGKLETEREPQLALIDGDDVNVRAEPSLGAKILTTANRNWKVYQIEERDSWHLISIPELGTKGWIFGEYLNVLDRVRITGDQVNIREKASLDSPVIRTLDRGAGFSLKYEKGDFGYLVSPETGIKGWVSRSYYQKGGSPNLPIYVVNGDDVNFRRSPNVDGEIIKTLAKGTPLKVVGREERWSIVKAGEEEGWVYSEFLIPKVRYEFQSRRSLASRLTSRGLSLRGRPYRWGGETVKGFDCSGFVKYLFSEENIDLPHSSSEQFYVGIPVDKEDLQTGDLVFFSTYRVGPSHVGVYLNDGDFVHASSGAGMVTISNLSDPYYKARYIGARRVRK